jgi:hypothetical protein
MSSAQCCWICGKIIDLESCKVDEHGMPVHEKRYIAKVMVDSRITPNGNSRSLKPITKNTLLH